jgi:lipopolysaccharide export LptBFGC system permease protein LptF
LTFDLPDKTVSFAGARKVPGGRLHFELRDVTIIERNPAPSAYPSVWLADRAEYADGLWTLYNIALYRFPDNAQQTTETLTPQDSALLNQQINLGSGFFGGVSQDVEMQMRSFDDLTREIQSVQRFPQAQRRRHLDVTRWFKVALCLMAFPFALCGPPLALRFARSGAFTGVLLTMGVVVAGSMVYFGMKTLAMTTTFPPLVAACVAPVVFTVLGVVLVRRLE